MPTTFLETTAEQDYPDMAIKKEDWPLINKAINDAIAPFKPSGWRRTLFLLREWGVLGVTAAVIVALFAIVVTLIIAVTNRREADATFRANSENFQRQTEERLKSIESTLSALSLVRAQSVVEKYSTAPPKELIVHRDELKQVKTTLAQLPLKTSPVYWTVSFQIITLVCRASFDVEKIAQQPESIFDNVTNDNLGAVSPIENRRVFLRNAIQGLIFKNSIVRFDPSTKLSNDVFIDCVFIFPVTETPPTNLQQIGKALLASDLSKVTINPS